MWVIRAYNVEDELVAEHELPRASLRDLERVLGYAPTQFGSTPLEGQDLGRIVQATGMPVEKGIEYFLDFDADPQPVENLPSPEAAATV